MKKIKERLDERREQKEWGKGTIVLKSDKELDEVFDKFKCQLSSPGAVAARLGVSRAYVLKLEREGKIRAYRIWDDDIHWDEYPFWIKLITTKKGMYIYIPDEDVEKVRKEMIQKAKNRVKKLEGE